MEKIMRRLSALFTVISVSLLIIACGYPVGSIGDIDYDDFWIISTHPTYDAQKNEILLRNQISAFASFHGAVDTIPINQVDIFIEDYPNGKIEFVSVTDNGHIFAGPGIKRIRAKYRGMEAEYSIRVLDPNDGSTPQPGRGSGGVVESGSGGNFIEW